MGPPASAHRTDARHIPAPCVTSFDSIIQYERSGPAIPYGQVERIGTAQRRRVRLVQHSGRSASDIYLSLADDVGTIAKQGSRPAAGSREGMRLRLYLQRFRIAQVEGSR